MNYFSHTKEGVSVFDTPSLLSVAEKSLYHNLLCPHILGVEDELFQLITRVETHDGLVLNGVAACVGLLNCDLQYAFVLALRFWSRLAESDRFIGGFSLHHKSLRNLVFKYE